MTTWLEHVLGCELFFASFAIAELLVGYAHRFEALAGLRGVVE